MSKKGIRPPKVTRFFYFPTHGQPIIKVVGEPKYQIRRKNKKKNQNTLTSMVFKPPMLPENRCDANQAVQANHTNYVEPVQENKTFFDIDEYEDLFGTFIEQAHIDCGNLDDIGFF
jgi:hypothetical protein